MAKVQPTGMYSWRFPESHTTGSQACTEQAAYWMVKGSEIPEDNSGIQRHAAKA